MAGQRCDRAASTARCSTSSGASTMAGGRSSSMVGRGGASSETSRSGGARCTDDCNRTHERVRRWLMPTALRPPTVTSPAPSPSKHTSADHARLLQAAAVHLDIADAERGERLGPHLTDPPHRPADVVVPQRVVARARRRRATRHSPGTSSTAPPPLRRRTTSTPAARQASASSHRRRAAPSPSTSAGRSTSSHHAAPVAPVGTRAWNATAAPRWRRSPTGGAVAAWPTSEAQLALARYGFHSSGTRADRDGDPRQLARRVRRASQRHAGLVGGAVALAQVARPARRGDVLPRVLATTRPGHDVVDASRRGRRSTGSGGRRGRTRHDATARCAGGTAPSPRSAGGSPTGCGTDERCGAQNVPSSSTTSALSASTRHAARRAGTTESGSYVAFRTERAAHGRDPTDPSASARSAIAAGRAPDVSRIQLVVHHMQVVQHIGGHRWMIGAAVLRDQPEAEVVAGRHRQERAAPPPTRRGVVRRHWRTAVGHSDGRRATAHRDAAPT